MCVLDLELRCTCVFVPISKNQIWSVYMLRLIAAM